MVGDHRQLLVSDPKQPVIPEPYRLNGGTGPNGLRLADYENPVFDGPQPRKPPVKVPMDLPLNTEHAGE